MKIRVSSILKITGIIIIVLLVALIIFANVMLNGFDETGALSKLQSAEISYEQNYVDYQGYKINTYRIGNPELPKALLIHGSPGHSSEMDVLISVVTTPPVPKAASSVPSVSTRINWISL